MIGGLDFAMAVQFKADGRGGYLYRKDQTGPAIPATAAERDRHVAWMGWMIVVGAVLYFGGMILMAVLADRFITSDSNSVHVAGAMLMAVTALTGLYLFLRWATHAPARAFAGRPEVEPAKSRQQVFGRRMARVTYTRIAVVSAGLAVFLLIGTAGDPDVMWLAFVLPAAIGIGFAIWKRRIEA